MITTMQKAGIRMIVFDIDGTMAETDEFYSERISCVMRCILFFIPHKAVDKLTRELVMVFETIGHLFYMLLDKLGGDKLFSSLHEKISGTDHYKYAGIGGLEATIADLSEKYHLAVITSGGEQSTAAFIDKFHFDEVFEHVVSAQNCPRIKPDPAPLNYVMREADLQPDQVLMVGDTIFDIICAHRAGAICAAVKTGFDNAWLLRLFKADVILDSIADLPGWLADQN